MRQQIEALDRLILEKRPELHASLCPGASHDYVADTLGSLFEKAPAGLVSLWEWHDGQSQRYLGDFHPRASEMFLSVADAFETMEMLNEYVDAGDVSPDNWQSDWLPFTENGGGNYTCVSISTGKVYYFDKYAVSTGVQYSSFSEWLEDLVDGYEKL
ncbi:SMI1/KNR4 family protein [Marinobacter sp. CA1]|uniref:SMI1/KNR4 family protein n=1 Tax=Marinobacter sp. CA1 TaxID=2817656 RepID=UPI001D09192C|nr:SMI1/KNR4 family protein [Marinobacter sp. CA1]UDL05076.1 SMI1/KNR4 family protein [Marinobacter sp. CA1]